MTADEVLAALERYHASMNSTWVILREAWAIDALAISRGRGQRPPYYRWIAYEIKVSRSDFKAELRKWPDKAQRALDFSHQYVFAVPEGLVKPEELARRGPLHRGLWVPAEAGVLEVSADPRRRPVMRKRPQTRQVARDLTPYDIACLVTYAHRPFAEHGARMARAEARAERKSAQAQAQGAMETTERAMVALRQHAGHAIEVGSRWMVPWLYAPYAGLGRDGRAVECEVVKRDVYFGQDAVWLRRVDGGGERDSFVEVGRFLLESERVS